MNWKIVWAVLFAIILYFFVVDPLLKGGNLLGGLFGGSTNQS